MGKTVSKDNEEKAAKHLAVADDLRRRIRSGEWKPGQRLPSYNKSRELFGVHTVTLEKAHAELEREGLIVRERRRGTFVADGASRKSKAAPARAATGLVGVAGQGFSFEAYAPYWVSLLRGMRQVADEARVQIVLLDFESNTGWEKADGVLICDWSNCLTLQYLPPQMPCVSVLVPARESVASVYADDYAGGRLATEHLLGLGHRRIAHLHSGDAFVSGRRLAGYRDALQDAGIKANPKWSRSLSGVLSSGASFVELAYGSMGAWLQTDWHKLGCTAIVAQNDETAAGIIEALRTVNLRVPEDVSVVGFDGISAHAFSSPRLTTVRVPLEEIGKTAMRLLLQQLKEEDSGGAHRVFPVTLLPGDSTGPVRDAS